MKTDYVETTEEIGGLKFVIRNDTSDRIVVEDNLIKKSYEKFHPITSGERWLDLGGYIGSFALRCKQAGAKVLSFEPDPDSADLYTRNQKLNSYNNSLIKSAVLQTAPSDKLPLFINTYRGNLAGSSTFARWKRPRPQTFVHCVSFSDAVAMAQRKLSGKGLLNLKLDIEGGGIGYPG